MARARRTSLGGVFAGGAITIVLGLGLWVAAPLTAESSDPNALWRIVHTLCATDMKASGHPAPCTRVDFAKGYAVLKDIRGDTQLLLIPTDRVTGIEAPQLLAPDAPNYFADAWDARPLFEARVGHVVARDDLALAINSLYGRSQQQLHIHIDCIQPDVKAALAANAGRIGRRWVLLDVALAGRRYQAMRLEGADLGERNPFKLLAERPEARADMASETLAVIGITAPDGRPGFVLLSDRAEIATFNRGTAEDLQDHSCKVLHEPEPGGA